MGSNLLIKNIKLLEEDSRIDDLFEYQQNTNNFKSVLDNVDVSATIGLVGKYGTGKSTMLFQLEKMLKDDNIWVNFDAWSHPDRKDLWDGFIISVAHSIGKTAELDIKNEIAGKPKKETNLVKTGFNIIASVAGYDLESIFSLFQKPPAQRISEMQEILASLINMQKKPVIVVAEDVDRSGKEGMYFLETLHSFIKNNELINKVIIIAPIGANHYRKHQRSYLKCLDYIEFFRPKIIVGEKFIDDIFEPGLFEGEKCDERGQIVWRGATDKMLLMSFLQSMFDIELNMTIRLLKTILRHTSLSLKRQIIDGHDPDWRVTIGIEASKYFASKNQKTSHHQEQLINKKVAWPILDAYISSIRSARSSMYRQDTKDLIRSEVTVKFIARINGNKVSYPSTPWYYDGRTFDDGRYYYLCDFYLDY